MKGSSLSNAALLLALAHGLMPPTEKRASDYVRYDAERDAREREARRVASAERMAAAEAKRARKNARRAAQVHGAKA
jgi:hypothetical protein